MKSTISAVFALVLMCGAYPALGDYCVTNETIAAGLPIDFDLIFGGLDGPLLEQFPEWTTRYNQVNTADPTPKFSNEDNSGNGIDDDDHLALLAAVIAGEPAGVVLAGLDPAQVSAIRASFLSNRAKVRPDLTLNFTVFQVNIIDEVSSGDPAFGETLKDLTAGYMTLGDAESTAFIRGLLITLGEIFIERGVASGDIPGFVEGLVKNTLRNTVNGNFVASRYECYGDSPGATRPNLLGDTGSTAGSSVLNEDAYAAVERARAAWLVDRGVTRPPLQIISQPQDIEAGSGTPISVAVGLSGGDGALITYDWKRVEEDGSVTSAGDTPTLVFAYPVPADTGTYRLYVCDGTWIRASKDFSVRINLETFRISRQPLGATVQLGSDYALAVELRGGASIPEYQWEKESASGVFDPIAGAVASELTLTDIGAQEAGTYRVRVEGDDGQGAVVTLLSESATVRLVDDPPQITLLGNSLVSLECGVAYVEPGAVAVDALDGDVTAHIQVEGAVDHTQTGDYTVTYSVTDSGGNTVRTGRTVTVVDTRPPHITLVGANPFVIECGQPWTDPGALATDECAAGTWNATPSYGELDASLPGNYAIAYYATDASGNYAQTSRTVQIVDTQAPKMTLLGANPLILECGQEYVEPGVDAIDACRGDLSRSVIASGTAETNTPGEYLINYSVSDSQGNTASLARLIRVVDTAPPSLALLGGSPLVIECGGAFTEPGATAQDVCAGDVNTSVVVTGSVNTDVPGPYSLTYTAQDNAGNRVEAVRVVTVVDTTEPTILLLGSPDLVLTCGGLYVETGATAWDACSGDLSPRIARRGAVDVLTPGTYQLEYVVSDEALNEATVTRTVSVIDEQPPQITLLGTVSAAVDCGEAFVDPGFLASDACAGSLTQAVGVSGIVDTNIAGEYVLTYRVEDLAGLFAETARTVVVRDRLAPLIEILGDNPLVLSCGSDWTDPGATASDACSGDLTAYIEANGRVDVSRPGAYEILYSVTDFAGNRNQATRQVLVEDNCVIEIVRGPQGAALYVGLPWTFGVVARGGAGPLAYTWRIGENAIPGAGNRNTYTIEAVALEDSGVYDCEITDGTTTVISGPARLDVYLPAASGHHSADTDRNWRISLNELLRVIQFYNVGAFSCADGSEDGYTPGDGPRDCKMHDSDYGKRDWRVDLMELLRIIQFFNTPLGAYHEEAGTEDGFAPGAG